MDPELKPQVMSESSTSHRGMRELISTIAIIVMAPLLALILTAFVFQTYEVDGASMNNTLANKDRLIVIKAKRSVARITGHDYIPHRYDIIIFNHSGFSGDEDTKKQLVKRVIGLPGERVTIKNNLVTVYNHDHPEGMPVEPHDNHAKYLPAQNPNDVDLTVGPHSVFVMGDNRDNSLDSREFGPVEAKDIVGKLALRIYPFGDFEKF